MSGRISAGRVYNGAGKVRETFAVGLLRQMLEIPSPSYREMDLAEYLAEVMGGLGFWSYVDGVGNVIGVLERGSGPVIMLVGHLDTIQGHIPVRSTAGRLYGRGAADAKGPLAAMICAAASATEFTGTIIVAGVVEEETPCSRGAMAIRNTFAKPDALIVGEPSGCFTVVLGYKGKLDLRYSVDRPPTHPSNPEPKASELAVSCWNVLTDVLGETDHVAFDKPGVTLDSISADTSHAVATMSVRMPLGFDAAGFVEAVRSRLTVGELVVVNSVTACRASRRNPAVRALTAGIRKQLGQPTVMVKTATSDMNTLAEVWDVPMATYGPGDSKLDHADDEHIVLAEYIRGVAVLSHDLDELSYLDQSPVPDNTVADNTVADNTVGSLEGSQQ
jgi:[amino group carrier protein]-lysine/ornithine hydrolase